MAKSRLPPASGMRLLTGVNLRGPDPRPLKRVVFPFLGVEHSSVPLHRDGFEALSLQGLLRGSLEPPVIPSLRYIICNAYINVTYIVNPFPKYYKLLISSYTVRLIYAVSAPAN